MKKLIVEKVNLMDRLRESGNYILWSYSETERGCNYTRLFRGTKKACIQKRKEIMTTLT